MEGQYTLDTLLQRLHRLHEFEPLQRYPLDELSTLVKRCVTYIKLYDLIWERGELFSERESPFCLARLSRVRVRFRIRVRVRFRIRVRVKVRVRIRVRIRVRVSPVSAPTRRFHA